MNTITIELSTEDRARQDSLIEKMDELVKTLEALKDTGKSIEPTSTLPHEEAEEIIPILPEEETAPAVTAADVQSLVVELVASGKKAETRAIIKEYADGVSLIPEDKLPEVLARLMEVKGV